MVAAVAVLKIGKAPFSFFSVTNDCAYNCPSDMSTHAKSNRFFFISNYCIHLCEPLSLCISVLKKLAESAIFFQHRGTEFKSYTENWLVTSAVSRSELYPDRLVIFQRLIRLFVASRDRHFREC